MGLSNKLKNLLSLSAASVAFFQGAVSAPANIPPAVVDRKEVIKEYPTLTTDKLVLTPATASTVQYAGHRSHSSHRSHASHRSHYSGSTGGGYVAQAPSSPPPTYYYSTPPAPRVAAPAARPVAVVPQKPQVSTFGLPSGTANTNLGGVEQVIPVSAVNTNTNQVTVVDDSLTTKIIEFQKKRAAEGSPSAQFSLGVRYLNGDGVERNLEKGKVLLEMSAEQGNQQAKEKLKEVGQTK